MADILPGTDIRSLGQRKVGKVRDVYIQPDKLILVTSDRHSSFDRVIAHIPWKGQVLNQVSAYWFEQTKDIVPNHVLSIPDQNVTVAKKCELIPVEAVVRGYLTGVTDTAIWTRYEKGQREFGGVRLPHGMSKNQKLPEPIFDPTTKEEGHDRALSPDEMIAERYITKAGFEELKETALKLFKRGQELSASRGLILVDTKYEFGMDGDMLTLIDEIHTPDSSRYWKFSSYEERMKAEQEPEYFDKEFLRLWFRDNCDPYKDATLPEPPRELVDELSRRYIEMYETITGARFERGNTPIHARIEKNVEMYRID
jgi:phosphoribosylaminoimidazole-succinocarboxamide synthase